MNTLMSIVLGGLFTIAASVISWFLARRKTMAEVKSTELDNVEKAIQIWRELAQGLEREIEEMKTKIENVERSFEQKCKECKYKKMYKDNGSQTSN